MQSTSSTSYRLVLVILITALTPIPQMTKLRLRDVVWLTQGHAACKRQSWNSQANSRCCFSWEGVSYGNKIWGRLRDFLLICKVLTCFMEVKLGLQGPQ